MKIIVMIIILMVSAFVMGCQLKGYESSKPENIVQEKSEVSSNRKVMSLQMMGQFTDHPPQPLAEPAFNTETYDLISENLFQNVLDHPLSTFSIDVDTASYSNIRRFLNSGELPPKDAVRIEEMINYFPYQYPVPEGDAPFSVSSEIADCPWKTDHRLLRIGLKGEIIDQKVRPAGNFVFLLDVSGSMTSRNKLPLLKNAMKMLVNNLADKDKVAIVV